jgi:MFS transporter, Spinster family, sphingosine-1-phosphate transporter
LGLLSGIAFTVFYVLMGIPIARWADRGNRVTIIVLTTILWCIGVSLCGFATTFLQLLLIRIGVAVGEPGCIPCAHSLIADNFSRAERPRAVSRFMLGFPLGAVIGNLAAGWLNQLYGWRVTFLLVGLPGLALALLIRFSVKEPRLAESSRIRRDAEDSLSVPSSTWQTCRALWRITSFRHVLISFGVSCFFTFGIVQWQSVFFIRQYGLQTGELGTLFAVLGVIGFPSIFIGGELASRYAASNERLQLRAIALLTGVSSIIYASVFLSTNRYLAFGLMGLNAFLSGLSGGPLFATLQTLVPPRMRAMSIAMIYLFANLIGMGLGPLAVGIMSESFRPLAGNESLRYALLACCPGYLWAGWHLWQAGRTVMGEIGDARIGDESRTSDAALAAGSL